jgi:tRNA-Thr(GGU) m(6)t(6)A37 methyltransferase TsaA
MATDAGFAVVPVGWVRSGREDPADTDHWGAVVSEIEFEERFGERCLQGLDEFSHVEVVFLFDRAVERDDYTTPVRPRGRADLPEVGVFCDRGPRRPNRLGVTTCRVLSAAGRVLRVAGLDAVVGTPVLDVKPAMREFTASDVRQPPWVDRLMSAYFLD